MIRNLFPAKSPAKTTALLAGFLVLVAAALMVLAFTNTGFTKAMPTSDKGALKGEIVAVDNGHQMSTLTLRSNEIGKYPNNILNIFLNNGTKVKVCGMNEPAKDLRVSQNATVRYHELGGVPVADSISERC